MGTNSENIILILYILNKLTDYISEKALFTYLNEIVDIDYFEFKTYLEQLITKECITTKNVILNDMQIKFDEFEQSEEVYIKITSTGKEYLELTKSAIPGITLLKADDNFTKKIKKLKDEESVVASYSKTDSGCMVNLCIIDNMQILMQLNLLVGSSSTAQDVIETFKKDPNDFYAKILNILQ